LTKLMSNKFLLIALSLALLSIAQVAAVKSKQLKGGQPVSQPEMARKLNSLKYKDSKRPILLETNTDTQHFTKDEARFYVTGDSEYQYYADKKNDRGDLFFTSVMSGRDPNEGETVSKMLFSLIKGDGNVHLDIYAAQETNNFTEAKGCEGFWNAHTHTIIHDKEHWAFDNCFLYNKLENYAIRFSDIYNVKKIIGIYEKDFTWVCNFQGTYWLFKLNKCDWFPMDHNPIKKADKIIMFLENKDPKVNIVTQE